MDRVSFALQTTWKVTFSAYLVFVIYYLESVAPGQKKDVEKMLPTLYMDAIVLDDRPDVWTTPNRVIRVHPCTTAPSFARLSLSIILPCR